MPGDPQQAVISKELQELKEQVRALTMQQSSATTVAATAAVCASHPTAAAVIRPNTVLCQLCHQQGHTASDCQLYRRGRNGPVCYYCRKRGHIERECRTKARNQGSRPDGTSPALNMDAPPR